MKTLLGASLAVLLPVMASASTLDFNDWASESYRDKGYGDWNVTASNEVVQQSNDHAPSIFFDTAETSLGTTLSGTMNISSLSRDKDSVGWAFGYNSGEFSTGSTSGFWLIDWVGESDIRSTGGGNYVSNTPGITLSYVDGMTGASLGTFWELSGNVSPLATGLTSGWEYDTDYNFDLSLTSSSVNLTINGVSALSATGTFDEGGFGLYNNSQSGVSYTGVSVFTTPPPRPTLLRTFATTTSSTSPVPLPAGMPLLLVGLGAFAVMRRKQA